MNTRKLIASALFQVSAVALAAGGCDTSLETGAPTETHDAGFDAALAPMADGPAALPIPSTPEFICDDGQNFQLQLPCELARRVPFLECHTSGRTIGSERNGHGGGVPVGAVDFSRISESMNGSLSLADMLSPIYPMEMSLLHDGTAFVLGAFSGSVEFYTANWKEHGFLGRFIDASFIFKAASGEQIVCRNDQGLFWAVAGNFL